jgi:zinc protease
MRALLLALLATACSGPAKPTPSTPTTSQPTTEPAKPLVPPDQPMPPAPAGKAVKVRTVEGITEYALDNGLQILLFPDQTQSNVTVNITYLVGSRHEGYGETGMAHLLEHMMFKGSPKYRNVLKLLQARGGQANGTTWLDRTNYYETLPATGDNLEWTLSLEADRMRNASISEDDLKTEFSVVRNEFEMGENNPLGVLDERMLSTAFLWHNYGKSTIGSRVDIEKVPVSALRPFYDKYYQPDNAMLVVSGKFEEATALGLIEKLFGAIPKPARKLTPTYTVEPVQDGERSVTLRRTGDVHVVGAVYHTVAGPSPDYPAVECAIDTLVREPSGRLYKKLVETKLAAQVFGWNAATHDPYVGEVFAMVRDAKHVDKVEKIMLDEIEKLGTTKIDDKEVERWRTQTLKELELAFADSSRIAVELSEWAAQGDWRLLFAYRAGVQKVTAADVARVAKTYFKASNRTLGKFYPTKDADRAPLTTAPDVAPIVKGIEGGTVKDQGEVFAATLDNIEKRTTRGQLKGGFKTALLPKKTRGGKVELVIDLHWGDEKSLQNKDVPAALMGSLMKRGTTKKSYQDVRDLEDQLKAKISIATRADGLTLQIETLRDKLPAALDLAAEMLTSPSFPEKELELVRQETLAGLEQQLQDPMAVAFNTLQQLGTKWPKGDPRYPMSTQETIDGVKKVRVAEIRQFYKDFAGAGHGELAVVGDFDSAAITAQVEKLFAGWQTKKPYARLAQKAWSLPGQTRSIDLKDKEMTTVALAHDIVMKDSDPDYAAWLMVSQVLGGDTGSRLWMRLREGEGLSYGVGSWSYADWADEVGGFGGYAIVAPANLAKAKTALLEEITKIMTTKPTADELRRAKDNWIKDLDTSLSNDNYVVRMLANQTNRGRTTEFTRTIRAKIEAVTADDVVRVAKKHLDPKRLILIDAGDKSKQTPPPANK